MSRLVLDGDPLAQFTFFGLPSWNSILGKHWRRQGEMTKSVRADGSNLARAWMNKFRGGRGPLIEHHVLLVAWVFPPHEGVMDIYNVAIKALGDGFTDASVWPDDEWAVIPVTLFAFGGIEGGPESRTVIDVHRLDNNGFVVNGRAMRLPAGRVKL